ncbi:hypothetical protein [Streptomyces sp. NPDC048266]|uniref:hypothetical protein n=1 Tax=Streptomyces sp. NPDC048266 TaxID=3155787 RepID=UPI0033E8CC5D
MVIEAGSRPLSVECALLSFREFTHSTLNDLLDRTPRPSGVLYPSQDIDPYGTGLLDLLDGRAETVVAWAHAGQWLGAGTALDAQGGIVPVLATVPR